MNDQAIQQLAHDVAALRQQYDACADKVSILDGLTVALIEDNDQLLQELAHKNNCILALAATVEELQRSIKQMAREGR